VLGFVSDGLVVCAPVLAFALQMCKEAAVLSRLQHPCIVRFWGVVPVQQSKALPAALQVSKDSVHDSAGSGGAGWIRSGSSSSSVQSLGLVMDRCDDSLEERLKMGPIPLSKALHVAERIACGLKYLHTDASAPIRVVHGDLKPANVLIKHDEVLLTDFGLSTTIAVHTMSMGAGRLFGDGVQAGGSLAWAAPELLEEWGKGGSPQPTFACDIYAFGILLQQLLVGKRPYVGMPPDALTGGVRSGRRPDWGNWEEDRGSEAGADVLGKLSRLVEACWAHSPGERPTAHEVHRQLVQVKKQLGPAAAP
jgi:serine/threonine protein kinase